MFEIKKNVPVYKKKEKYPFNDMEVGDMFEFEEKLLQSIRMYTSKIKKLSGKNFIVKRMDHGLYGCWRLS